jgi:hypothetical protein
MVSNLIKGLKKMKAYEEKMNTLQRAKLTFCNNSYNYLKNAIGHVVYIHLYLKF